MNDKLDNKMSAAVASPMGMTVLMWMDRSRCGGLGFCAEETKKNTKQQKQKPAKTNFLLSEN